MLTSSLKARLTLAICALIGLLWLLAAAATWLEARHEAEELFDAHLIQAASLLIAQTNGELDDEDDDTFEESHAPELHRYARRVAFQVWLGDRLRLHSANAPDSPLSGKREGLSDSVVDGERWRVFSAWNERRQVLIQVGERISARDHMARTVAAGLLKPLLIALPLAALFIWLAVRHGVRPLERIAAEVERRSPEHLAELPTNDLPTEVQPLVDRLNALFGRVARSFKQERRFTADAAHELRTPLAGLRAQAQVALGATEDAARRHALNAVLQGCDRMTHLVEQLLLLARVDAAGSGDFVDVDFVELVREVVGQLVPQAINKEIDIELKADAGLSVRGNPAWLSILVRNLVDNAIRYTPRNGRIRVAIEPVNAAVSLVVEDDGPGVAEEELSRLGQRFWRSQESVQNSLAAGGSGLGLSIVGRIAELHGGRVDFASNKTSATGSGMRIQVRLPKDGAAQGKEMPPR
ncbi:ATP-binding protein [Dechloromonas agitata]|uniref:ATP-binding protein n=1 Tax=Dechloromonas agitata TaxID=73030 RepID=UPI000485937E|nr:ATP-binding protein [Dechloromonas agitata]